MMRVELFRSVSRSAVVFALSGAFLAPPAFAQEPEEAQDLGVIIVTAQKRAQDILEVPIAVSAFSGEALEAAQISTFSDITRIAPALSVTDDGNKNQQVVSIRGIGTYSFSISTEPTVSTVVDNVALLQPGQAFGSLSDISRIEVLRGPQGTLFGKNASAGVINIVTAAPTDYFSAYAEATLTTDDERRVGGMISGPLTDSLGFRLNGYYLDREGYLENLTTGDRLNGEEGFGFRAKLVYDQGILDATLIADYSESDSNSGGVTLLQFPPGTLSRGEPVPAAEGITAGPGNNKLRLDGEQINDTDQLLLSLDLNVDLGFATLSSISSLQRWDFFFGADADDSPDPTLYQSGPYEAGQFAQELRLTSPAGIPVEYMFGLFYADGKTDRGFRRTAPSFLGFLRQNWTATATTESMAAFAQLGFNFGEDTKLNLGGRLNRERIGAVFNDGRTSPARRFEGSNTDTAFTWRASLQHFVSETINVFASAATGYKGAAYDISSNFNQRRADNPVESENSASYEIGTKGRLADGLASFSLVGFWTDYDDFQAQGINAVAGLGGVPEFALINVGSLRTRGIELEGTLNPTDGLSFFGSAAYIDATIREYPAANCYPSQTVAQGCVNGLQNLAGADLPSSPDFKFNLGASYETGTLFGTYAGFINLNYVWQSDVFFGLTRDPLMKQEAFGLANLNFGLVDLENDNMQLTFFVNNVFDQAYTNFALNDPDFSNPVLLQQLPRNYTRYFGLRLRAGF